MTPTDLQAHFRSVPSRIKVLQLTPIFLSFQEVADYLNNIPHDRKSSEKLKGTKNLNHEQKQAQ